jgi:AcrR family transcriptional regulator
MAIRPIDGSSLPHQPMHRPAVSSVLKASDKKSRFSREETTTRILDAAEDLFSRRDPDKVTMREIAEAAGVTHPLVHQYVGSKADIQNAVVERGAPRRREMMAENSDLRDLVPLLAADVVKRRVHSRAIVRSAMDGVEYAPLADRIENGRTLLSLAGKSRAQGRVRAPSAEPMDPRVVLAAVTALLFGWVAVEDWLSMMFDLEGDDLIEARRQMGEIAVQISELVLPVAEEPPTEEH